MLTAFAFLSGGGALSAGASPPAAPQMGIGGKHISEPSALQCPSLCTNPLSTSFQRAVRSPALSIHCKPPNWGCTNCTAWQHHALKAEAKGPQHHGAEPSALLQHHHQHGGMRSPSCPAHCSDAASHHNGPSQVLLSSGNQHLELHFGSINLGTTDTRLCSAVAFCTA